MEKIKVACATHSMSGYYEKYFPGMRVFGHEDNVDHVDLLILTGGSDINPSAYSAPPMGAVGWDDERDTRELNIIRKAVKINPDVKILGVCRGLQMLNVWTGGDLIQDLASIDKSHSGVHRIQFNDESHPLSWMETVNSLHHQAVRRFGYSDQSATIVAVEPTTGIAEIVSWGDSYLGVQFHPELFSLTSGSRFFSVITDWVTGKISMFSNGVDEEESEEDWDEDEEEEEGEEITAPNILGSWSTGTVRMSDEMQARVNELLISIRENRTNTGGTRE